MSCIKERMQGRFSNQCPQCLAYFSIKNVRLLDATRLCIPADQKESITRFPYNKKGFTAFKQYQRELLTNAFNNRSHALKQRAVVLVRQKDAMERQTELLIRMARTRNQAEALDRQAGVEKLPSLKERARTLQFRAAAMSLRRDEYLRKADAFGQQAKEFCQQAKALRQQVGAYMKSMQFFKQHYKELLGLHVIRSQMDMEEDHKPMEANKEYNQEEEEQQVELEFDLDNNDDFEQVEEMTLPLVISRNENGKTVHEIEVPVMKDDDFIDDSMYRDDRELTDSQMDFAEALDSRPPSIQAKDPDACTLCCNHWTVDQNHQVCCLPCGHIFGESCIKKWLQTDANTKMCPICKIPCTLKDVRPLNATSIRIPAAIKGADAQKTSTRRFPLCNRGIIAFHNFETARRNVALKKWWDAKKRLDGVLGRKYDLLDRMKALEQQGEADASLAVEYMMQAKACERRAEALRLRAKAYNQRVDAWQPRLSYFVKCVEDVSKLG
ncbi:zinc finger, RING/FYVE/PHD-type [Artemisia annua]|nr:zinc finger, RING/FYVE/PHD-type [Artemisia annua]